jgi:hypothetical protein
MAYDQKTGINTGTWYGFIDDAVGLYFYSYKQLILNNIKDKIIKAILLTIFAVNYFSCI